MKKFEKERRRTDESERAWGSDRCRMDRRSLSNLLKVPNEENRMKAKSRQLFAMNRESK
jgi:hypothetical protein